MADRPCLLTIEAVAEEANRVLTYSVTSGSLPTGITLSPQGNLIGTVDASDFTDSTTTFNFTVTVSDQYQSSATSKEFRLDVDIPFTTVEYGSMTGDSTSLIDQNIFYNIAQDQNINSNEYIYRGEDPNFGIKVKPEILIITGIEAQTLTIFQNQMQQNHSPKTLFFGDVKTAVAKENGVIKYEVVYIDIVDPLVNNDGNAVSSSVSVYNDSSVFPNALENMRTRMKELGHKEWTHLPLWMKTTQEGDLAPLGWVPASVICYCKPGTSALLKKRIDDKGLIFRNIDFVVDRYRVNKSVVTPAKFTGDGSTKTFELDEIVHEEDILVKEEGVRVFVGEGVRADGSLEADSNLRSADHEFGIELTHDTSALKTTINFIKSAPSDGSIITVDRLNDKYLKFRDKGY